MVLLFCALIFICDFIIGTLIFRIWGETFQFLYYFRRIGYSVERQDEYRSFEEYYILTPYFKIRFSSILPHMPGYRKLRLSCK
jgi:hypothetical protein